MGLSTMPYFAHTNGENISDWQTLLNHLQKTADIASFFGHDAGISEFTYLAGLLHDLGKYSEAFQKRLFGASQRVDHSTAGAQTIVDLYINNSQQAIIGELLAYCIAGHHSGLPNYGSVIDCEEEATLQARLKRKNLPDYSIFQEEIQTSELKLPVFPKIQPSTPDGGFSVAFFTRMIYSALVDADFIETETYMQNGTLPRGDHENINILKSHLDTFLKKFSNPTNPINAKRTETLNQCIFKAKNIPGLFSLTVPTGGGKTISSLAFALNHAIQNHLNRIIYVIPYTSIIEQNAAVFKNCLGEENVLEHHANFDWKPKNEVFNEKIVSTLEKLKLASENWDIPIIVTTNVQFFESLYANRSSSCRKVHNMARSVIIFDEAQMLPMNYLKPCFQAVFELVKNYRSSAIFCTATQPAVHHFFPKDTPILEIVENPSTLYQFYKRIEVKPIGKQNDEEIAQRMNASLQVLCIVNTRKHAKGLFEKVNQPNRFHLSTLMCPKHRKETISTIREQLKQGHTCRVISTQIMEAGIDVDFPTGFRSLAGLDSIVQAAGRINREGKNNQAFLYVFEPDSEFVKRTPKYIQQTAEVARMILQKFKDPICIEAIENYYEELYDLHWHNKNAFDSHNILNCFNKGIPNFDFKTAAENFNLIENYTIPIIIPFNKDVEEILYRLRYTDYPYAFSRSLQPFTVNIYEHEFRTLSEHGLIDFFGDIYHVLNDLNYYDEETGLLIPEQAGGEAIFFDG
jgi:CRISPR-associated endonuclease/helicase Cas3